MARLRALIAHERFSRAARHCAGVFNHQSTKNENQDIATAPRGPVCRRRFPGLRQPPELGNAAKESQFKELKPGDKIVYACNQCQTVTEKTIGNTAEAMEYCKEDTTVMCPSCKTTVKLVTRGAPKNQTTSREVKFVNDKGEECFFIAKVVEAK